MKVIRTWDRLEEELERFGEFNSQAEQCLDELLAAARMRSRSALAQALARWKDLRILPTFSVSPELYAEEPDGPPTLRLLQ